LPAEGGVPAGKPAPKKAPVLVVLRGDDGTKMSMYGIEHVAVEPQGKPGQKQSMLVKYVYVPHAYEGVPLPDEVYGGRFIKSFTRKLN